MRYKIALDIDEVLAQFYPAMCKRFNQPCKRINIWDGAGEASMIANNFHIVEHNRRFWLNLDKMSNPHDITFKFECYITSSPPLMAQYRKEWLLNNGFPDLPVIVSNDKVSTMRQRGIDVLIDDKPSTLEEVKANGFIPIQFVPPYMSDIREHLNPIVHLSQVPQLLANY